MKTIFESFLASCVRYPEKSLFERPGQADLTYADTLILVRRLARTLKGFGVMPGDRVAVQVDKCPEVIALYLATLQLGAIYLPLNTGYTGAEIDYFVENAGPTLFVCQPGKHDAFTASYANTLRVESLGAEGDGTLLDLARMAEPLADHKPCGFDEPAAILYTSGTTGRSKGAVLTHGNLASNVDALLQSWRFSAADRLIHALPVFHTHGLFVAVNMSIAAGATMIWLPKFDPEQVIDLMPSATVLMGVPTFYTRLVKSTRLSRKTAQSMRLFVSGSAPLLVQDHRDFEAATGHLILERYGMTETCMIASNPYDGERKPGAVGMPLSGVELRITDRHTGQPIVDGEIGLIEVRGPNVFSGYWKMPEKTAAEFRADGFFITGDLGMIDKDGYLQIVGRDKDLVISGGYNVYPKEVEGIIDDIQGVIESAVVGVAHPDLGEAVTAVVVVSPGAAIDASSILAAISDKLARYKQPRMVVFVDELPRNTMGKVQKEALRNKFAEIYAKQSA